MRTYKCTKVARGILLITGSFSLYLFLVFHFIYLSSIFLILGMLIYLFLNQCRILINSEAIEIKWIGQIKSSYDIPDCRLCVHQGAVFEVIFYRNRWLWFLHLIDKKSALITEMYPNKSAVVLSAKENNKILFTLLTLRAGLLISCLVFILPAVQYFQIPSEITLYEVKGLLARTDVNKSLVMKIEGYTTLFFMSPKAGNLTELDSRVKPNLGKELSVFVTQNLALSEVERAEVWEIRMQDQKIISYAEIRAEWLDWKRFISFLLLGTAGIAYCMKRIKSTDSYIKF